MSYLKYLLTGFRIVSTIFLALLTLGTLSLAITGEPGEASWGAFWFFFAILVVYLSGSYGNWEKLK
jgi:hypothetical protein